VRLNRFLSLCGLGSRRGCEDLIRQGRVTVNKAVVTELATTVGDKDEVTADGKPVRPAKSIVLVLNKPKGYLCTREDTHERATIYDILPAKYQHLHHVGRLDKDSEGLILLTNRGDLSHRLLHPSEGVEKEYEVRLETEFDPTHIPKLVHGVMTAEGFARAERVFMDSVWKVNVVLKQGLKRQIRLMFYEIGYEVERLVRTRIGGLKLYGLPKGGWKELTEAEVERYFFAPMRNAGKSRPRPEPDENELAPRESLLRKKGAAPAKKAARKFASKKPYSKSEAGARKRFSARKQQSSRGAAAEPQSRAQKPAGKGPRRGAGRRPSGK
jgi:23S rRNA pseudouridine2605 synthase